MHMRTAFTTGAGVMALALLISVAHALASPRTLTELQLKSIQVGQIEPEYEDCSRNQENRCYKPEVKCNEFDKWVDGPLGIPVPMGCEAGAWRQSPVANQISYFTVDGDRLAWERTYDCPTYNIGDCAPTLALSCGENGDWQQFDNGDYGVVGLMDW